MADTEKKEIRKWISRPGKRKPMGKKPRTSGKSYLNPKWREEGEIKPPTKIGTYLKNIKIKADRSSLAQGGKMATGKPHTTDEGKIDSWLRSAKRKLEKKSFSELKKNFEKMASPDTKMYLKTKNIPYREASPHFNKGGKAIRGYGKAYMKGGRVK